MTLENNKSWSEKLSALKVLLPSSQANLSRLSSLLVNDGQPKIAVFGKYNHGKSTLLNALIGEDVFKVADKRETTSVSEYSHNQVTWIDTPGLDADVKGEDDKRAMAAALESADILCLVHNVKAGELDRSEMQLYKQLIRQDNNYRSKLILVLSQIDQVTTEDLEVVVDKIHDQLPDLQISKVSALRYVRGKCEDKKGFIKASGVDEFLAYLGTLKTEVSELRIKEARRLIRKARVELAEIINDRKHALTSAKSDLQEYEQRFWSDLDYNRKNIVKRAETLGLK